MTTLISDVIAIFASVMLARFLVLHVFPGGLPVAESIATLLGKYFKQWVFFSFIVVYLMRVNGLYDFQSIRHPQNVFTLMLKAAIGVLGLELLRIYLMPKNMDYYGAVVLANLILIFPIIYLFRWVIAGQANSPWMAKLYKVRVLILGTAEDAEKFMEHIQKDAEYEVAGWVPVMGQINGTAPDSFSVMNPFKAGQLQELPSLFRTYEVDAAVILPNSALQNETVSFIVNSCENAFVQIKLVSRFFPVLSSALHPSTMGDLPVMGVEQLPLDRLVNRVSKRSLDIVGAVVGLLLSAPLIAIFAFLVWRESPGPVFYTQVRNGLRNRHFKIIKIRSMRLDSEVNGAVWAQKDDPRRLSIGGFMRKWNIDELPQFWNVLKGEMSLVGPRPERPELVVKFQIQVSHYGHRQTYHPGMTGWAAVNGWRGDTSLQKRIEHDIWYIEHWSIWLDMVIMLKTFLKNKNAY